MVMAMAKTKRVDGGQGATEESATYAPCLSPSPDLACLSDLPDELPVLSAELKLVRVYFRDLIEQALCRNPYDI